MAPENIPTVETTGGTIRLGQFLKLADLADSGSHARELIAGADVKVDGEVTTQRGRQLSIGMLVEVSEATGTHAAYVG